jgi:hypothetical protein
MKFAITLLVALTLAQPALSMTGDTPMGSGAKPTSFVPHHTNQHVYGTPIERPIMGRAKASHRQHASKKQSR